MKRKLISTALVGIISMSITGCGNVESAKVKPSESTAVGSEKFDPVKIDACGTESTITSVPKRVVFVNSTGAPALVDFNLLDRVVGRIGEIDTTTYSPAVVEKIKKIKVLEAANAGSGHSKVSTEAVLEVKPDLLIGSSTADMDMEKLAAAKLPVYIPKAYCGRGSAEKSSYDDVYKEIEVFGAIFGKKKEATKINSKLKKRVADAKVAVKKGTAAAVYVTPGDSKFYFYGPSSMITPQMETSGLENVYVGEQKRVFVGSMESLLDKNPDYVIVLYQTDKAGALKTFNEAHGAADLKAVKNKKLLAMPFPLVDPPSSVSIAGMEKLKELVK